jgi:predicted RNA methylase
VKIDATITDILDRSEIRHGRLILPQQLDRAVYARVNKALVAAGGKWNRAAGAHVFAEDPRDVVEAMILTGEIISVKQAFGYFATTPEVLARLMEHAALESGQTLLEPSAGCGVIARAGLAAGAVVDCVEIRHDAAVALHESGLYRSVQCDDFLTMPVQPIYDRVVMNPPFARQADLRHVRQAFDWLKPGGRLVSVMSAGVVQRSNRASLDFQDFVADHGGVFEELPENAFRASGTQVRTVLVSLVRPCH